MQFLDQHALETSELLRHAARMAAAKTGELVMCRVWWVNRDNETQNRALPFGNDYAAAVCEVTRKGADRSVWAFTIDDAVERGLARKGAYGHDVSLVLACFAEVYALTMAFPEFTRSDVFGDNEDDSQALQPLKEPEKPRRRRGRPPKKAKVEVLARLDAIEKRKAEEANAHVPPPVPPLEPGLQ